MLADAAGWLVALSLFSIATIVLMATLGTRVMVRMPADYFIDDEARGRRQYLDRVPMPLRPVVHIARNLLGLLLVLIGVLLLFLPGQGLLTMVAGLILMDFPGKYACERWLVRRRQVRRAIDWMRRRAGQPPLVLESAQGDDEADKTVS